VAPRFLIDENLSPMLALHLRTIHGFDAVHVNAVGLRGASDPVVLAYALAESRIIVTSNADDFRRLVRRETRHPGLAVLIDAVGRQQQIALGTALANAIDATVSAERTAHGLLFEIDATGRVRQYRLP
jgi:predicted nuclease of predicted toxin-antitoxin system